MMNRTWCLMVALLGLSAAADAVTIKFDDDPFAGTTARETAGRQVIGNELFTSFDVANDAFEFDDAIFGVGSLRFANDEIGNIPPSGANLVVLRTFDNDADPATPFGAGTAANLLAERIATPGAGFFVYFNSALDLPRLVFSTDLSDNTADLKILARLINFTGQAGRDALANVSTANFADATPVPTPAVLSLFAMALAGLWFVRRKRNTAKPFALPMPASA